MLRKIEHVGIMVSDMDRSIRFYTEVLGLTLRERVHLNERTELAFLRLGESEVELIAPKEGVPVEGRVHHLAFTVDDINAALARIKAAGAEWIDAEPREVLDGCKIAFFKGPDGELLELFQRPR